MVKAEKANAILWIGNIGLIVAIVITAIQLFLVPKPRTLGMEPFAFPPSSLPPEEVWDASALTSLPNPLLPPEIQTPSRVVLLIGIDRIKDDDAADTAYLFLVGRKLYVNAYVGEPIREGSADLEVSELAGWRLKSITSKAAVFSTPLGEVSLGLAQGPASLAAATPGPADARTMLDVAVNLYKDGRLEDACVVFEEALHQRPSSATVYAFMRRTGEDVIASIMNSKDEKIKEIGYRLFELAKLGGERIRSRTANA